MPIFRHYFWEGEDQVWDRHHSPSLMGAISEAVRTWPSARRSGHAPQPVAAVGADATDLCGRDNRTDFGFDSPFQRLIELNAWILLLGVDWQVCTLFHLLEERAQVPYREWVELRGTVIDGGVPVAAVERFAAAAGQAYAGDAADAFKLLLEEGDHALTMHGFETAAAWLQRWL